MKQILKKALSILAISAVIYSCTQEDQIDLANENSNNLEILSSKITLTESTNKVSSLFFNLGVSEIDVKSEANKTLFSISSERTFNLNDNSINLSDYSVSVNEKLITLNEDERFKIGIRNNRAFIITPNYSGFYDEADLITKKNAKTFILISFLNEILYTKEKVSVSDNSNFAQRGGCSFWDQGFSVGVGINNTSAQADLQASMEDDIAEGSTEGCTKIGKPEAVPWTNGTVWAQAWCCA
jgi:hypothetical protein|tara:strand:- start:69 stop:788 length:720 start_codon:yes stop_codon:yes gene_type:complete